MTQRPPPSSGSQWRSEEDYYLARLATNLGLMDEAAVERGLLAQGASFAAGQPITLGDIFVRDGILAYDALLHLMHELMRSRHTCQSCSRIVYSAPGPVGREEACPHCGALIAIPPAASVTQSGFLKRDQAMQLSGSFRLSKNALATAGRGPTLFGSYVLEQELARGGMGAVYRVRHSETGRELALKVMLAGSRATEKQVHRFKREAKAQFELDHPNIVKIHDVGENDGVLYYAMDLIQGKSLDDFEAFKLNERLGILAKVCRALHYAHESGYIHRDLKPANILINSHSEPLVTDFGLAKNLDGQTQLTQEGAVMGTPFYMAPEQATGSVEKMGPCTDVFALGVLLYQMVTTQLPFEANTAIELYRRIIDVHPKSFAEHGVMAPELELVAFKAIEKLPEFRYPNALELAEDIERCMRGEKPHASSVSSTRRMALAAGKHKRSIGFILGMVVLGLVVLIGLALGFRAARDHFKSSQLLAQRDAAAKDAQAGLDQALAQAESQPAREAVRFVEEALSAADELLALDEPIPEGFAELRVSRAKGLVARAELALGEGSGRGASLALECLAKAKDDLSPGLRERALGLRVQACWRLGRGEEADAALAELRAGEADKRQLALLEARRARLAGDAKLALSTLGAAGGVEAELERAHSQLALGQLADAAKALRRALEKTGSPARVHLRWGEALLALGRLREAASACSEGLELDPGDLTVARRMTSLYLSQGRPLEAIGGLRRARKRQPGLMELEVLLARARFLAGEDVSKEVEALADLPEGAVLLGDVKAAAGDADPYAALAGAEPLRRVIYERWRVDQGKGQPANLAQLNELLEQIPHDRPPSPALARAVRELGWILRAQGDGAGAQRAAEAALRGLPHDLDASFLLAHLDPQRTVDLEAAFCAEADQLQGALGRGLFISRALRHLNRKLNREELLDRARRLLRARLAGQPSLYPLRVELAALAKLKGEEPQPTGEGSKLLDWDALLPPRPLRHWSSAAELTKIRAARKKYPGNNDANSLERAKQVLKINPEDPNANWNLAVNTHRLTGRTAENRLLYLDYLRLAPGYAFSFVYKDYACDWVADFRFGSSGAPPDETKALLKKDPHAPRHQVPWIMDHYFGVLYPKVGFKGVKWSTDAAPHEVVARIDGLLRHEPELSAFLYLRAHMVSMEPGPKRWDEVERDLELVGLLAGENLGRDDLPMHYDDWLYRMWIYAPSRLDDACAQLDKLLEYRNRSGQSLAFVWGAKDIVRWKEWVSETPQLEGLREDPRYREFEKKFVPPPGRD